MTNSAQSPTAEGLFQIHFYLAAHSHEMDAEVLHQCEGDILGITYEIGRLLDVEFRIEAMALGEGGIRYFLKVVGENAQAISLIVGVVSAVCGGTAWFMYGRPILNQQIEQNDLNLKRDRALSEIQIEQSKIDLKKAKIELRRLEKENSPEGPRAPETAAGRELPLEGPPGVEEVAPALSANPKIARKRSSFYSNLLQCDEVEAVSFAPSHHSSAYGSYFVPRAQFASFIINTEELTPEVLHNVNIEVVAPVLKPGNLKWHGNLEGKPISFRIQDDSFLEKVHAKGATFRHGTYIRCDLEVHSRQADSGEIEAYEYIVLRVRKIYALGSSAKPVSS
jgi:hypothetical protein